VLLDDHTAAGDLAKALNTKPTTGVKSANIKSSENELSASGSLSSSYKISSEYGKQGDLAKPDPSTEGERSSRQDQIKLGIARGLISRQCRTIDLLQTQLLVSTKEPPHLENHQPKRTDTASQSKDSQEATLDLSIAQLPQE